MTRRTTSGSAMTTPARFCATVCPLTVMARPNPQGLIALATKQPGKLTCDGLPGCQRAQVSGLTAVHDALQSRFLLGDTNYTEEQKRAIPPARRPLVQTDRHNGRKTPFVGIHACEVEGMSLAEGRMLLLDLLEHATQREYVYNHSWQPGDLVMWDNTATLHRGRHVDVTQRRELRRATTQEVVPQAALSMVMGFDGQKPPPFSTRWPTTAAARAAGRRDGSNAQVPRTRPPSCGCARSASRGRRRNVRRSSLPARHHAGSNTTTRRQV